jgi:hypothetical protein
MTRRKEGLPMNSKKVSRWVALVSVSVLGACGGVSSIGSGEEPGMGKSGSSNVGTGGTKGQGANGAGAETTGAVSTGATGGKEPGGAGSGAAPGMTECKSDKDCPNYGAPCEPCADGSYACNRTYCAAEGYCVHTRDSCAVECSTDKDCPVRDIACEDCGDGSQSCPSSACVMGFCQESLPSCGGEEQCKGQACGSACKACAPGDMCDPSSVGYCSQEGKCQVGVPKCSGPSLCMTAADCGTPPPMCVECGNDTCAKFECIEQKCVFACPPNPKPECTTVKDCPDVDDVCIKCQVNGMCAVQACVNGSCEMVCPVQ